MRKPTVGLADRIREHALILYKDSGRKSVTLRHVAIDCSCSPMPVYGVFDRLEGMLAYCLDVSLQQVVIQANKEKSGNSFLNFDLALLKEVAKNKGLKAEFSIKNNKAKLEAKLCEKMKQFLQVDDKEISAHVEHEIKYNICFMYSFLTLLHPSLLHENNFQIFEKVMKNLYKQVQKENEESEISVEL